MESVIENKIIKTILFTALLTEHPERNLQARNCPIIILKQRSKIFKKNLN